jgi:hypothetical protein
MKRDKKAPERVNGEAMSRDLIEPNQWAHALKTVGIVGAVFGANPLAAHAVAYVGGPALLAYTFAASVILLFFLWCCFRALPRFRDVEPT